MKKILVATVAVVTVFLLSCGHSAFAQWDLKGCSQYGVSAAYPETIESTLWTFRSNVWDGYIDFQEGGKYWTHFGFGTWTVTPDGKGLHLANDYNNRTYEIAFTDNGFRYQGIGNNGLIISGQLICSKYQGPGPQVPDDVAKKIAGFYKSLLQRDAEPKELIAQYRRYIQGASVDDIMNEMMQTPEYKQKAAAAAKLIKEREANGTLGW